MVSRNTLSEFPKREVQIAILTSREMVDGVEIRVFRETRVAYMRYVGPYGAARIAELWYRFEPWCAARGLRSPRHRMFGIAQDNPNFTPPERTRYDACIEVDADFQPEGDVAVQTIPAGRHACTPFTGKAVEIRAAWIRFLTVTLPDQGLMPEWAPAIEMYAPDFAIDPNTGVMSCTLCMPLRRS
jgi:AraC family transcriptional regulator